MPAKPKEILKVQKSLNLAKHSDSFTFRKTMNELKKMAQGEEIFDEAGKNIKDFYYRYWSQEDFLNLINKFCNFQIEKNNFNNNVKNIVPKNNDIKNCNQIKINEMEVELIGCFEKIGRIKPIYLNHTDPEIGDLSKKRELLIAKSNSIDRSGLIFKNATKNFIKSKLKIAIVASAWKTQDYIEEFLNSIENNTMMPFVLLIGIDNCKETKNKIEKIIQNKNYSFDIRVYFSDHNVGTYNIRNNLNDLAFDEYFCDAVICIDSDDMIHHEYIKCYHDILNLYSDCIVAPNLFLNFNTDKADFYIENYNTGVNCFTKQIWKKVGYYFPIKAGADSEWIYRSFKLKQKIIVSNSMLYYRRLHSNQLTNIIPTQNKNPIRELARDLMLNHKIYHPKKVNVDFKFLKKIKSIVGIATWKPRMPKIERTLKSLTNQADEIHVFLNEYDYIPDWLPKFNNVYYHHENGKNYGASAKFKFQNITEADYYFSCDDDIIYPPDYIKKSIEFEKNNINCLYSYHGTILKKNFLNWMKDREIVFHYKNELKTKKYVHVGGSGVMFWNLNYFKIPDIFDNNLNNDEIQVINWAHQNQIKIVCPDRNKNWIQHYEESDQENSLWAKNVINSKSTDDFIIKNKIHLIELSNEY